MNNTIDNKPKVKRESKNRIKVEFERTPLKERLKAKFLSLFFLQKFAWYIFRLVLLVGISYIVLFPFISKIMGSFMDPKDFIDATVILIPKNWTLDMYKYIFLELDYTTAFLNTLVLSGSTAVLQMFTCAFIAYGLAKFKFKGSKYIFMAVILTMVIPHATLQEAMYTRFLNFDIFGIFKFLGGGGIGIGDFNITNEFFESINIAPHEIGKKGQIIYTTLWRGKDALNLINTYWPMVILSITGLGFKNGLYIFLLRQFFRGVPDELEESAYMDGSGTLRTFITVIIPLSVPMLITVFLFAFSWQWTDNFYTDLFINNNDLVLLNKIVGPGKIPPKSLNIDNDPNLSAGKSIYYSAIRNTCGLMIIAPLVIMYSFFQKYLVQGIERSGLTAD